MRSAVQNHYNKIMTNIAVEYRPQEQSWDKIMIPTKVEKESDFFPVWDKAMFDVRDTRRADKTPSKPADSGFKLDQYACEEYAQHALISKRERDNSDLETLLESRKTKLIKQMVMNDLEMQVFGAGGILRTAANNVGSANVSWATLSTASPRTDVETGIEAIEVGCGKTPNTIVLTPQMARHIMRTAEYQAERHFVVDMQQLGGVTLPSSFYGLTCVYVQSILSHSSGAEINKGQARSLARVMADDIWIGYIDPSGATAESITYGAWLNTEEYVASWWDDDLRADKYEYGSIGAMKVIAKECGYLMTSALT